MKLHLLVQVIRDAAENETIAAKKLLNAAAEIVEVAERNGQEDSDKQRVKAAMRALGALDEGDSLELLVPAMRELLKTAEMVNEVHKKSIIA